MMALVLTDLASNIGKRAFMKMRTLEGSNYIAMKTSNVSLESRAKNLICLVLGKRVTVCIYAGMKKIVPGQPIIDRPADLGSKL